MALGVLDYRPSIGLSWIDAMLFSRTIPTGIAPVDQMQTDTEGLFSLVPALCRGAVYPALIVNVLCPAVHRMSAIRQGRASMGGDR